MGEQGVTFQPGTTLTDGLIEEEMTETYLKQGDINESEQDRSYLHRGQKP
jgi:hypothetical protein